MRYKEHSFETLSIREKSMDAVTWCLTWRSVHFNISLEDARMNYEKSKYRIFDMHAKRLRYKRKRDESDYKQGSDDDVDVVFSLI